MQRRSSLVRLDRLHVPDHLCVFIDASIRAEEAHPRDTCDRLREPFFLILVCLVNELLGVEVGLEVVGYEVVVAVVYDRIDQSRKLACIAEGALLDRLEDSFEIRIKDELAVEVRMAEVLDIFGKIAKKEDVVLADFTCDLEVHVSDQCDFYSRRR